MAVFRIERTRDYTVMSNHHLRNANLSLKAKGLLSMMLSLPEDWNYTTRGLAKICKEGVDAIGAALRELEGAGYIVRHQRRDKSGRITDTEYVIYEQPQPCLLYTSEHNSNSAKALSLNNGLIWFICFVPLIGLFLENYANSATCLLYTSRCV